MFIPNNIAHDDEMKTYLGSLKDPEKTFVGKEFEAKLRKLAREKEVELPDPHWYHDMFTELIGDPREAPKATDTVDQPPQSTDGSLYWKNRKRDVASYLGYMVKLIWENRPEEVVEAHKEMLTHPGNRMSADSLLKVLSAAVRNKYQPGVDYVREMLPLLDSDPELEKPQEYQRRFFRVLFWRYRMKLLDIEGGMKELGTAAVGDQLHVGEGFEELGKLPLDMTIKEWALLLWTYLQRRKYQHCFKAWEVMKIRGIEPTASTFKTMFCCCWFTRDSGRARRLWEEAKKSGLQLVFDDYKALFLLYSNIGHYAAVESLFEHVRLQNLAYDEAVYVALATAYAKVGKYREMDAAYSKLFSEFPSSEETIAMCYNRLDGYATAAEQLYLARMDQNRYLGSQVATERTEELEELLRLGNNVLATLKANNFHHDSVFLNKYVQLVIYARSPNEAFDFLMQRREQYELQSLKAAQGTLLYLPKPKSRVFAQVMRVMRKQRNDSGVEAIKEYLEQSGIDMCFWTIKELMIYYAMKRRLGSSLDMFDRFTTEGFGKGHHEMDRVYTTSLPTLLYMYRVLRNTQMLPRFQRRVQEIFGKERYSDLRARHDERHHHLLHGPRQGKRLPGRVRGINWWV